MAALKDGGTAPGEDFIELGLLCIVAGLTAVLIGALVQLLVLKGQELASDWLILLILLCILGGLSLLAFKLVRRLLWFLSRLR